MGKDEDGKHEELLNDGEEGGEEYVLKRECTPKQNQGHVPCGSGMNIKDQHQHKRRNED